MEAAMSALSDPCALIDTLDPEQITDRLADLDREARALRVLLRAARTRRRNRGPDTTPPIESREASRAD
jgi:hypothetical protein